MSWIKEANKIGKYEETRYGFRIYCTKECSHTETIITIDGEECRRTDFHPGHYTAIDNKGRILETKRGRVHMWEVIDIQQMKDYYSNK